MIKAWNNYWFRETPLLDVAIVRIACCTVALFYCVIYQDYHTVLVERVALEDSLFRPTALFKLVHLPFGWGYEGTAGADGLGVWAFRPPDGLVLALYWVFIVAGILALVGLATNVSLAVFAGAFFYTQSYMYSFGDFHHPEAVMAFALGALALSPSGRVLSLDNALRARRGRADDLMADAPFAGWAIRLMQWFFALMYFSAFHAKLSIGGLDWMNGYTLQLVLIEDGLRWNSDLALWLSQFHILILLGQWAVMIFQATFFLEILIPRLRWIYIPAGLFLHASIYILQGAPFFTWIALYSIFIPWRDALLMFKGRRRVAVAQQTGGA